MATYELEPLTQAQVIDAFIQQSTRASNRLTEAMTGVPSVARGFQAWRWNSSGIELVFPDPRPTGPKQMALLEDE